VATDECNASAQTKEVAFHDVSPEIVRETITYTFEVIRVAWKDIYGCDGPRWLPNWEGERFGKRNIRVVAPEISGTDARHDVSL
jgi:hypothetical protein